MQSGEPQQQAGPLNAMVSPDLSCLVRHGIRIFLVRHGESEANVDKTVLQRKPDHAMELTPLGKAMAHGAGEHLRKYFESTYGSKANVDHHVRLWCSPFYRTRQTAEEILKVLNPDQDQVKEGEKNNGSDKREAEKDRGWIDSVREHPFLAEQDFGVFETLGRSGGKLQQANTTTGTTRQGTPGTTTGVVSSSGDNEAAPYDHIRQRNGLKGQFDGQFWARSPHGESHFDVCVRLAPLIQDVVNDVIFDDAVRDKRIQTVIIVSHGNTVRAFIQMWCRLCPEWFSACSVPPPNCSIQLIENREYHGFVFSGYQKRKQLTAEGLSEREIASHLHPYPIEKLPISQAWVSSAAFSKGETAGKQNELTKPPAKMEELVPTYCRFVQSQLFPLMGTEAINKAKSTGSTEAGNVDERGTCSPNCGTANSGRKRERH